MGTNFSSSVLSVPSSARFIPGNLDEFGDNGSPGDTLCMQLRFIRFSVLLPSMLFTKTFGEFEELEETTE
jgi:hypothetical protein